MALQTALAEQVEGVVRGRQTGLLAVRAQMEQAADAPAGTPTSLTLLFKNGQLVSVHVGESNTLQAYLLLAQIATVIRSRWTPMRADLVADSADPKASQALIRLLRYGRRGDSKDVPENTPGSTGSETTDLYERAQAIFLQVFGDDGAEMLAQILSKVDAKENPVLFLRLCVDQLSPMLGHRSSVEMLMPPN